MFTGFAFSLDSLERVGPRQLVRHVLAFFAYGPMKNIFLFIFVGMAATASIAQETSQVRESKSGLVMGERDKSREDEVSKLFESIRSGLKISKLKRIEHRDILEEEVCTVALTGTLGRWISADTFALYRTSQPGSITTELNRVASFEALHPKSEGEYRRYSVAVWRTKDSQTGEPVYWVGVELYWSAPVEFFDYHFTDGMYDLKNWEKSVAPQCRNK
jgi:hypothetical protein